MGVVGMLFSLAATRSFVRHMSATTGLDGIARSWELVGGRGASIVTSITALADRDGARAAPPEPGGAESGAAEAKRTWAYR